MTELFIENQRTDISSTLASLMTFNIDDVKDFASRQTAFSKTVVLPGSGRNNKLFGSIFDVSITNDYDSGLPNININFNASVSARCLLFQDNLQTFKGALRILQINIDRGKIEYEAAISGELSTLNVRLSSGLLEQLDFSAYNHVYNVTNIVNSWDNLGSGYYYPLADYGTYSTDKHNWSMYTFRPAMFVKEYIDKMFAAAGFRYVSALFETTRFKSLIVPHNQKVLLSKVSEILNASEDSSHDVIKTATGNTSMQAPFDVIQAGLFTYMEDAFGGRFTYNDPTSQTTLIQWQVSGTRKANTFGNFTIKVRINGVALVTSPVFTIPPGGGAVPYVWTGEVLATINQNDVLDIYYEYGGTGTNVNVTIAPVSWLIVNTNSPTYSPVSVGGPVLLNDSIPKNIRQVDFLTSIVKLFNLYITEDRFDEKLLYIEPYVDFYSEESQNAVDWTYKLDRSKPLNIQPMSEINAKVYNFNYASDSDYYNDLYKKRYNQTYGSDIFDTQFEFVSQKQDINLIFAGTPLVGYGGEEKVYPTIFKLNNDIEEKIDSVIRILQTKKITGVSSWNILDSDMTTVLTSRTDYGYAGHYDDPDNVTNDLNFGALQELFFILVSGDLSVTQFNLYWSPYMAEITDKDSKMFTGKFYLKASDILNLDFSKYVNVDGSLFRLNKITDYNVTKPDLCMVELLKVINTLY